MNSERFPGPFMVYYKVFFVYFATKGGKVCRAIKSGQISTIDAWNGSIYMGGNQHMHPSAPL
jgi:hypothetical protein